MNSRTIIVGILVCVISLGFIYYQLNQPITYAVGDKWVYQHEGPRPFKDPSNMLSGDRVREIIRCESSGDEKVWVFRDEWGAADQFTICYVDEKNECCRFEEENNVIIENDSPLPFDYCNLKIGESMDVSCNAAASGKPTMKIDISAKRLNDDVVSTPAGKFSHCRHVQVESKITDDNQSPPLELTYTENYWYHSSVNGFVRYELNFDPINVNGEVIDGYKASSVLKEFIRGSGAVIKTVQREEAV